MVSLTFTIQNKLSFNKTEIERVVKLYYHKQKQAVNQDRLLIDTK